MRLFNSVKYQLKSCVQIARSIYHLTLVPAESVSLHFVAGQYVYLMTHSLELPYSIANAPFPDGRIEFIIRIGSEDRETQALIDYIRTEKTLEVKGPFGDCVYQNQKNKRVLIIVGGVGFAQAKAIIEQAEKEHDQRNIEMYWSLTDISSCFYHELLLKWLIELPRFNYKIVLTRPDPQHSWQGITGRVSEAIKKECSDLSNWQTYISGPWSFVDAVFEDLKSYGLSRENTYSDRFAFL